MLNKVFLIGRLGQDPELKYSQSGTPFATFSLATDETYTDKSGNRVEKTEWHRIIVFQRQAENCANFLKKGSLVFVEGNIQSRKYQDQQGQDRTIYEIKAQNVRFLVRKSESRGEDGQNFGNRGQKNPQYAPRGTHAAPDDAGSPFPSEAEMDDMPF